MDTDYPYASTHATMKCTEYMYLNNPICEELTVENYVAFMILYMISNRNTHPCGVMIRRGHGFSAVGNSSERRYSFQL